MKSECRGMGHPPFHTFVERAAGSPCLVQPDAQMLRFVPDRDHSHVRLVWASIRVLFGERCPSAVVRFVVTFIVDSVERVFGRRARTHVTEELRKRIPSFAHRDSSSSVGFVHRVHWVSTPTLRLRPSAILGTLVAGAAVAMLATGDSECAAMLDAKAATRSRGARLEGEPHNGLPRSAIAATLPTELSAWLLLREVENRPSAEALSCKINQSRHVQMYCTPQERVKPWTLA